MSEPLRRAHVIVTGHVQGVFFRASLRDRAHALGLAGWVRNTADGSVEAALEGPAERVESLVEWCRRGPRGAAVHDVAVVWEDPRGETGFSVRQALLGRFVGVEVDTDDAVDEGVGVEELTAGRLLELPVRSRGIRLGRPVDLIVDLDAARVLAIELLCGDDVTRLLPIAASHVGPGEITVRSALVLLDEAGASFYRQRGRPLRELRRGELADGSRRLGRLVDVVFDGGGAIAALVVEPNGGPPRRVAPNNARSVPHSVSAAQEGLAGRCSSSGRAGRRDARTQGARVLN